MSIFIGADHRGFELKNKIIDYLQEKNTRVEDMGNYEYDALDDNPDFAQKVSEAVLQNPREFKGIIICGSGVGVCISSNRYQGIRCGLGFDKDQVEKATQHDHINMLALPADYVDFEKAKELVDVFIETKPIDEEKYLRRVKKMDHINF